jgi:alpha-glucosidase
MFYLYPNDPNAFGLDLQYFYGPGVLISPMTEENSTSVDVYFPRDIFFELWTYAEVQGQRANITITDQGLTNIPLHVRGGVILPMRVEGANTTTTLRTKDFTLLVPVGTDGTASGQLYLDEGDAIVQPSTSHITFKYQYGQLKMDRQFGTI